MCENFIVSSILKELEVGFSSCEATNKFGKSIGNLNASYSLKSRVENSVNAVLLNLRTSDASSSFQSAKNCLLKHLKVTDYFNVHIESMRFRYIHLKRKIISTSFVQLSYIVLHLNSFLILRYIWDRSCSVE